MKVLIVNDGTFTSNWGLQASTTALSSIFRKLGYDIDTVTHAELHKQYQFEFQVYGKPFFNQQSRILQKLSPLHLKIPQTADEFSLFLDLWSQGQGGSFSQSLISKIRESDLVVFNAEGSTYRKNHGALTGLFLLFLAKKLFNKPSFFVNGSFTLSAVDNVLQGIATLLFNSGIPFLVREPYSQRALISIGVESTVVPDSVFLYAQDDYNKPADDSYFCVSKSMLPMCKYATIEQDPFFQIICKITKETGLNPFFLARDPEDQMILKYKQYLPNCDSIGPKCDSFTQVQAAISHSSFLLSGRYHHLIFGLNSFTNVCPLSSSSHKIEGLVQLVSQANDSPCFDPTNLRPSIESVVSHCVSLSQSKYKLISPLEMKDRLINSYTSVFA